MGIADRVRRRQTELRSEHQGGGSPTGSESSLAVAEPPHIIRLKGVVRILESIIKKNDDGKGMARMAFFMSTLTDELADELAELDEMNVRIYMFQIGEVISWIGHGDNERLPEALREFANLISPTGKNDGSTNTDEQTSSYTELGTGAG